MRRSDSAVLWSVMCAFTFFGFNCQRWGVGDADGLYRFLTYQFTHANIFHLLCNSWCLLLMLWNGSLGWKRLVLSYIISAVCALTTFVLSYIISAVCALTIVHGGLTVGFSGVLFAAIGIQLGTEHDINIRSVAPLLFSVALSLIFMNRVAVLLHVLSCVFGFACAMAYVSVVELRDDSRRLHGIGRRKNQ